jgi:hypothetical protein
MTLRTGKRKTAATAAFLGVSGLYKKKDGGCCVNVTNPARKSIHWVAVLLPPGSYPHLGGALSGRFVVPSRP